MMPKEYAHCAMGANNISGLLMSVCYRSAIVVITVLPFSLYPAFKGTLTLLLLNFCFSVSLLLEDQILSRTSALKQFSYEAMAALSMLTKSNWFQGINKSFHGW